jgi:xanthine dehydrogenase accessory factor
MLDLAAVSSVIETQGAVVRVVLAQVRGSTPRTAGTDMLIWQGGSRGTIGGGRLEWEAEAAARAMLAAGAPATAVRKFALGPALNQCCGGAVTVVLERWDAARLHSLDLEFEGLHVRPVSAEGSDMPAALRRKCAAARGSGTALATVLQGGWLAEPIWRHRLPVYIYGAGHVGRALAQVLHPMPGFDVCVSDTRAEELGKLAPDIPAHNAAPTDTMQTAAHNAAHLIMTPEHDLDLTLCHKVLARPFAFAGLIGSATKWARFRSRLAALGHTSAAISRITSPIGDPALGKHPQAIAVGVAAQLLKIEAAQRAQMAQSVQGDAQQPEQTMGTISE